MQQLEEEPLPGDRRPSRKAERNSIAVTLVNPVLPCAREVGGRWRLTSLIEHELNACAVIAALIIRDESLEGVLLPLHRPLKLGIQRVRTPDEGLHAECTTA